MTKILFFIETLTGGGAEKVLRTLVNHMDQTRFEITVQTVEQADPKGLLAPGIRYQSINRCRTRLGKKLFSLWIRLCAQLKWLYPLYIRDDYDIEVAYLECGSTKIMAGSTDQKALKLAWVHCDLEKKEGFAEIAQQQKQYYQAFDKVVCVSEQVKKSFANLIGNSPEAVVLYNVNDEQEIVQKATAFAVEKPQKMTFAAVGRLSYEKGNDRLLNACSMLREQRYDFELWLIGDGNERKRLEQQVKEQSLDRQVRFLGFQENPYPYMAAADAIVCPSRYEGFSTVVTEALILGKPVVTTPCSGMDELLGSCEYGLITEDSVEGIRSGMKRLLEDPHLRASYAEAAKGRGRDFSKAKLVSDTERFLHQELANKRGG